MSETISSNLKTQTDLQTATKPVIIYACSGCSDAGELADIAARTLTRRGAGQMSCLAGIGGRVKSLISKAENAERILVIDGCPLQCARHTLEGAGFKEFDHLRLNEIGLRKGDAPTTSENVEKVVAAALRKIDAAEGTRC